MSTPSVSVDDRIEIQERSDARHADQGLQAPDPRRWRALALLGTAFFMVILDGTIVITALPVIGHELGLSAGGLQ